MTPKAPHNVDDLAGRPIDDDDIRILTRMARLYDTNDPVPDGLVDRVQFAITLDALHAELAELQRSSDLVGVRSPEATEAQTITFTSASLTTMVTITATSADRVRIDGWAAPGGGLTVELHIAGRALSTVADPDGRFVFDGVPRGLGQFLLRPPSGSAQSPVVTPSIEL